MVIEADVVLPVLDEAEAIPWVLERMPSNVRAIVVDNGSTDGTADVARAHGALVVAEPTRGYGAAVHAGLLAARADLVAFLDGDGSLDAAELPTLVRPVADGHADLAVGRRRPTSPGVWPWHARLGNALLAHRVRRALQLPVHDLAPVRAAHRAALLELDVEDRAYGYPMELLVRAARAGWRVVEVDVRYGPRAAGTRSKVSGTVRGTVRAARDLRAAMP